jgi:hypothetical protein
MGGGVSGAASGGILGLVLVLLGQQFGYITFTTLEGTILLLVLVILVFAVVFGLLGRAMKGSAVRRAKAGAATGTASDIGSAGASPPVEPGTPPSP